MFSQKRILPMGGSLGLSDFFQKVNRGLVGCRGGHRPNPPALLVSRANEKKCKYGYMALFHKNASFLRGDLSPGLRVFFKKVFSNFCCTFFLCCFKFFLVILKIVEFVNLFDTRVGSRLGGRPNPPALLVFRAIFEIV